MLWWRRSLLAALAAGAHAQLVGKAKEEVMRSVKDWAHVYEKRTGKTILLNVRVVGGASESMRTLMNNTGTMAKKRKEELK